MLRFAVLLILVLPVAIPGLAQKKLGQTWIVGNASVQVNFGDTVGFHLPANFLQVNSTATYTNICDTNGAFLFGFNGVKVFDSENYLLQGGDSLGDNSFYNAFECCGGPVPQGAVILPIGSNRYYLFYYSVSDSMWEIVFHQPNRLYYAEVDMSANGGAGAVLSKNNLLYGDTMGDSRMTACRHANGRDWWLVVHGYNNNRYLKFLITPFTMEGPFVQDIGAIQLEPDNVCQAVFSRDGNLYASVSRNSDITILDFDRCSGEFSNPRIVHYYPEPPYGTNVSTGSTGMGLSFSPSGRYLYANNIFYLHQFDLSVSSVDSSRVLIGMYDTATYICPTPFELQYLMPDDRIFITSWDGCTNRISVVNFPDSAGIACGFEPESYAIPQAVAVSAMSNQPYYGLGKIDGGPCDTIVVGVAEALIDEVSLYPNPTKDKLWVRNQQFTVGQVLEVWDVTGRMVLQQAVTAVNSELSTVNFPSGIYLLRLGQQRARFVKE